MITRWEGPFILRSPTLGDLNLNTDGADGRRFQLVPANCNDRIPLRAERLNIPQARGTIPRRRFTESFITQLAVRLDMNDGSPACDQDLVEMTDDLMGWLGSMLDLNDAGRLLWEPYDGYGDNRMYDEARWFEDAVWSLDGDAGYSIITFSLDTPFPYAIDATQQTINVAGPTNLTNTGNTTHFPVIKVNGPFTTFIIENTTTGESIEYDGTLPGAQSVGGGDYAEIDTFRNVIYLNGDEDNLKPGLVVDASEFWGLVPGVNALDTDGPDYDVLFNPPWL